MKKGDGSATGAGNYDKECYTQGERWTREGKEREGTVNDFGRDRRGAERIKITFTLRSCISVLSVR